MSIRFIAWKRYINTRKNAGHWKNACVTKSHDIWAKNVCGNTIEPINEIMNSCATPDTIWNQTNNCTYLIACSGRFTLCSLKNFTRITEVPKSKNNHSASKNLIVKS